MDDLFKTLVRRATGKPDPREGNPAFKKVSKEKPHGRVSYLAQVLEGQRYAPKDVDLPRPKGAPRDPSIEARLFGNRGSKDGR